MYCEMGQYHHFLYSLKWDVWLVYLLQKFLEELHFPSGSSVGTDASRGRLYRVGVSIAPVASLFGEHLPLFFHDVELLMNMLISLPISPKFSLHLIVPSSLSSKNAARSLVF